MENNRNSSLVTIGEDNEFVKLLPALLTDEEKARLEKTSPVVSLAQILWSWLIITACIIVNEIFFYWPIYLLTIAIIGARMHALMAIMHDATHYKLAHNRAINDLLCNLFVSWPVLISVKKFRRVHFKHHRYTNLPGDPDYRLRQGRQWQFPMSRTRLAFLFLLDLTGLSFPYRAVKAPIQDHHRRISFGQFIYYALILAGVFYFDVVNEFLLYWVVPYVTWLNFTTHLRSIGEHFAIYKSFSYIPATRTILTTWLEKIFIAPLNVGYHTEHHVYADVPSYNLKKLHRLLMQKKDYVNEVLVIGSYWQLCKDAIKDETK